MATSPCKLRGAFLQEHEKTLEKAPARQMQQNESQILSDLAIKPQPVPNLASHLQPASSFWSVSLKLLLILTRSFSTNLGFTPENFASLCVQTQGWEVSVLLSLFALSHLKKIPQKTKPHQRDVI